MTANPGAAALRGGCFPNPFFLFPFFRSNNHGYLPVFIGKSLLLRFPRCRGFLRRDHVRSVRSVYPSDHGLPRGRRLGGDRSHPFDPPLVLGVSDRFDRLVRCRRVLPDLRLTVNPNPLFSFTFFSGVSK